MHYLFQKIKTKFKNILKIKESKYFLSFLFFIIVLLVVDYLIYVFELPEDNTINSIPDIMWWNIVTLTTVGYGDMYPTTTVGKMATIMLMICGIATFAYFLSAIVEYVLDINQRNELGLLRIKMENHIIICNWNERASDLFNQLRSFEDIKEEIVLIDNTLEERPSKNISFVKGSPTDTEILKKANVQKAARVIALAKGNTKSEADANTVLTSLAVKSLAPNVMLCAEILDPNNAIFLKNAKVDHIIDINSLISRFIAQTAYNPKLLAVLNELVSNTKNSCEIYRCKLPDTMKDMTYFELFKTIKNNYDCMIIALENSKTNDIIINPKMNQSYNADFCFVIAEDQPVLGPAG
ncbi:MAG: ion channel [Cyanobacteriota bacterium]